MGILEQIFGMETPPTPTPYRRNLAGMGPRGGGPDPAEVQRSKWVQNAGKAVHDASKMDEAQLYELKQGQRNYEKLMAGGQYAQAMHQFANKDRFDATLPELLGAGTIKRVGGKLAHELGSAYKSRLQPAIDAMQQEKMTAAQAQGHFAKYPGGVGADELQYTGVQGMLDSGQPVTKTGLMGQAQANPLQINDVVKGGKPKIDEGRWKVELNPEETEYAGSPMYDVKEIDGPGYFTGTYDEGIEYTTGGNYIDNPSGTKFSDYTLPGGEDYRELLMTLPERKMDLSKASFERFLKTKGYNSMDEVPKSDAAKLNIEFTKSQQSQKYGNEYAGGHYDEPNILAHARYNTRNIDGDKTLFIEEIQSDWHQAGRQKGYKGNVDEAQAHADRNAFYSGKGDMPDDEWSALSDRVAGYDKADNAVPDAPYKATDKWQGLAFQRTVKEAVDQGHDRIAWTPGDVQADRYDLSKQVTEIRYNKVGDDKFEAMVFPIGQEKAITRTGTPDELSDFVGKEIAEKMAKGEGQVFNSQGVMTLGGGDLKVGGEGMKSFYDKMMVKTANKFGKKYGAKVEVKGMDKTATAQPNGNGYFEVVDQKGEELTTPFDTMAEADAYVKNMKGQEVWSMKITPEMKKAMAGGVALSGLGIINMPGLGGEE